MHSFELVYLYDLFL